MVRVLVLDDEVDALLGYLTARLEEDGHAVSAFPTLAEALEAIEDGAFDVAVIDIMFPIREEDDRAYRKLSGRNPRGIEDALKAGIALIKNIASKPVYVVTHYTRMTAKGREVWTALDEMKDLGRITCAWEKPPPDEFYEAIKSHGAGA